MKEAKADNMSEEKNKEVLETELRTRVFIKSLDPYYSQVKEELDPLITRIIKVTDKTSPRYLELKENAKEWTKRFAHAIELSGKISSLQTLWRLTKEPQLLATLKLFHYLGLVESIGTTILDMATLLLIADGHAFHVHRPRVMHAKTFADIENVRMSDKLIFLRHNGLETLSEIVNRNLRNDIAHLKFDVDERGKITTDHYSKLNINKEIADFNKRFIAVFTVLEDCSFIGFLNRIAEEKHRISKEK